MVKKKLMETDNGLIMHVSLDGLRYYPEWMVAEYATANDLDYEGVLKMLQGDKE